VWRPFAAGVGGTSSLLILNVMADVSCLQGQRDKDEQLIGNDIGEQIHSIKNIIIAYYI
jgi:hypothetical protein